MKGMGHTNKESRNWSNQEDRNSRSGAKQKYTGFQGENLEGGRIKLVQQEEVMVNIALFKRSPTRRKWFLASKENTSKEERGAGTEKKRKKTKKKGRQAEPGCL